VACPRWRAPVLLSRRRLSHYHCQTEQLPPIPSLSRISTATRALHRPYRPPPDRLLHTATLEHRALRFQYHHRTTAACRDLLLEPPFPSVSHRQAQLPPVAVATGLVFQLRTGCLLSMVAAASQLQSRTTLLRRMDRAQQAQHHPTTRVRLTVAAHLHRALLPIFRHHMAAALLFLLLPPPLSRLQLRLFAPPTRTRIIPTRTAPPTLYTVIRLSPVRPTILVTAASRLHTLSNSAWMSATSSAIVLRRRRMVKTAVSSVRSLVRQVATTLWQRTRSLDLRPMSRLSLSAPTE
jgi:hypothetical protein